MGKGRLGSLRALAVLLFVGLLAGCSVPDVGPFVDATGQLKSAVASSGSTVEETLRLAPGSQDQPDKFARDWKARNDAMAALLNYANSLSNIVSAGNAGAETFGHIADSVGQLASAAGIALPGSSAAVSAITDTGRFIAAQIAHVRAARSLAQAMETAQPAIEAIADKLRKDLQDTDKIVQAVHSKLDTEVNNDPEFNQLNGYRKGLVKEIDKHPDPAIATDRPLVAELSKLLADTEARRAPFLEKIDRNDQRLRASRQLIAATASALDVWSATHAQIAAAARNKRTVSATALVEAAVQVRDLAKRIREI